MVAVQSLLFWAAESLTLLKLLLALDSGSFVDNLAGFLVGFVDSH